jgi:hypothetical protein
VDEYPQNERIYQDWVYQYLTADLSEYKNKKIKKKRN